MSFNKHLVLDNNLLKENICIIGDVHGCLNELKDLLEKVFKMKGKDKITVIFVGDLVNKGPYSAEVISYVRNLENSYCVMGNHEYKILKKINNNEKFSWKSKLMPEDYIYLQNLPYSISLPSLNAIVVHAGMLPDIELNKQNEMDVTTIRNIVTVENKDSNVKEFEAIEKGNEGEAWALVWNNVCKMKSKSGNTSPHIYFGHDAKRNLQRYEYATGLDTGCCYGKELTAIILPNNEFIQVKSHKMYQKPKN